MSSLLVMIKGYVLGLFESKGGIFVKLVRCSNEEVVKKLSLFKDNYIFTCDFDSVLQGFLTKYMPRNMLETIKDGFYTFK